jgi:hypothetical protein
LKRALKNLEGPLSKEFDLILEFENLEFGFGI